MLGYSQYSWVGEAEKTELKEALLTSNKFSLTQKRRLKAEPCLCACLLQQFDTYVL